MRKLNMGILKRVTAVTLAAAMVFNYGVSLAHASSGIVNSKGSDVGLVNVVVNPSQIVDTLIQNKGSGIGYTSLNEEVESQLDGKIVVASEQIGQTDVLVAVSVDDLPDGISYEEMQALDSDSSVGVITEEKKEIMNPTYEEEEAFLRETVASSIREIQVYAGNSSGDLVDVNVLLNEADQWNVANADGMILTEGELPESDDMSFTEEDSKNSEDTAPTEESQVTVTPAADAKEEGEQDVAQPEEVVIPEDTSSNDAATGSAITSEPVATETPAAETAPVPEQAPAPTLTQIPEKSIESDLEQAEVSNADIDLSFQEDDLLSVVKLNLRNTASGGVTMNVSFTAGTNLLKAEGQLPILITTQDGSGNTLTGVEYSVFQSNKFSYNDKYHQYTGNFSLLSKWNDGSTGSVNLKSTSQNNTYCIMQIAPSGYKTPDDFIATFRIVKSGNNYQITDFKQMQSESADGNILSVEDLGSTAEGIKLKVTNGIQGDAYNYIAVENNDGLVARLEGNPVFCYNKKLKYPSKGDLYIKTEYSSDVESNQKIQQDIRKVLFSGYPFNDAGLTQPGDIEIVQMLHKYGSLFEQDCEKINFSMMNPNTYKGLSTQEGKEIFNYMLSLHQDKNFLIPEMVNAAKTKYPDKKYFAFINACQTLQSDQHTASFQKHVAGLDKKLVTFVYFIMDSHLGGSSYQQIIELMGGGGQMISDQMLLIATSNAVWKTLGESLEEIESIEVLSNAIINHAATLNDPLGRGPATFTLPEGYQIKFHPVGEKDHYITNPISISVTNSPGYYYVKAPAGITVLNIAGEKISPDTKISNNSSFILEMNGKIDGKKIEISTDGYEIPDEVNFYKPVGILSSNNGSPYCANQNMVGYTIIKTDEPATLFSYEFGTKPIVPNPTPEPTPSTEPTPEPTPSTEPTGTPEPTPSAEPTGTPEPTPSAEPTGTPEPTPSAEPTGTPAPTPSAEPTGTPAPTESPDIDLPEPSTPTGGSGFYPPPYNPVTPDETSPPSPTPASSNEPSNEVEIPEEDVPLSDSSDEPEEVFNIPDLMVPLSAFPEISIPDEDVPLADSDLVEIEDENVPLGAADSGVDIPDEDVPLGLLPQTGGSPLSLLTLIGIGILITGIWMKKRKVEE